MQLDCRRAQQLAPPPLRNEYFNYYDIEGVAPGCSSSLVLDPSGDGGQRTKDDYEHGRAYANLIDTLQDDKTVGARTYDDGKNGTSILCTTDTCGDAWSLEPKLRLLPCPPG